MVKALVMMITFGLAGVALAEGGADRTFARMETARQSSMQAYQIAQQKTVFMLGNAYCFIRSSGPGNAAVLKALI